jgi:hypothetical protein
VGGPPVDFYLYKVNERLRNEANRDLQIKVPAFEVHHDYTRDEVHPLFLREVQACLDDHHQEDVQAILRQDVEKLKLFL